MEYTNHAVKRTQQRNEGKMYKMEDILEYGYRQEDFRKGSSMRKYMNRHVKSDKDTIIIYDKNLIIIRDNCVITLWQIPQRYIDGYDWDGEDDI